MKSFYYQAAKVFFIFVAALLLPAWFLWLSPNFHFHLLTDLHKISFLVSTFTLVFIFFTLKTFDHFPGQRNSSYILYSVIVWYFAVFAFLLFLRLPYSLSFLSSSFAIAGILFYIEYFLQKRFFKKKYLYLPFGRIEQLEKVNWIEWLPLENIVSVKQIKADAIVVDLHSPQLTSRWQKFLSDCVLRGLPVYNLKQVEESLTGRIKIQHMYENDLGSLLPSPIYILIKQLLDFGAVVLVLPFVLPIMFLIAVFIKIESRGSFLFSQKRVGKGGREFIMYKFRSMYIDSEKYGSQFASLQDARVTRLGKFLRKFRLDELPQFFNILKGEMSLIGPRPEQKKFVEDFEKEIPFYNYRHVVRPGISGWAQVIQGYTADVEKTTIKVQYDFFYIKNFSFSLDVLIFFKTIKTILTGFGSR